MVLTEKWSFHYLTKNVFRKQNCLFFLSELWSVLATTLEDTIDQRVSTQVGKTLPVAVRYDPHPLQSVTIHSPRSMLPRCRLVCSLCSQLSSSEKIQKLTREADRKRRQFTIHVTRQTNVYVLTNPNRNESSIIIIIIIMGTCHEPCRSYDETLKTQTKERGVYTSRAVGWVVYLEFSLWHLHNPCRWSAPPLRGTNVTSWVAVDAPSEIQRLRTDCTPLDASLGQYIELQVSLEYRRQKRIQSHILLSPQVNQVSFGSN